MFFETPKQTKKEKNILFHHSKRKNQHKDLFQ